MITIYQNNRPIELVDLDEFLADTWHEASSKWAAHTTKRQQVQS